MTKIILLIILNIFLLRILLKKIKWSNTKKRIIKDDNEREFEELLTFEELLEDDKKEE